MNNLRIDYTGLNLLSNVATMRSESDPESSSSTATKHSSEIQYYCACNRCKDRCKRKRQKNRTVCARCRDKRCMCKVCGQIRMKVNKDDRRYVKPCNCTNKK